MKTSPSDRNRRHTPSLSTVSEQTVSTMGFQLPLRWYSTHKEMMSTGVLINGKVRDGTERIVQGTVCSLLGVVCIGQ